MQNLQKSDSEKMLESLRLRATTISPLHIGSHQQTLDKTEYLVNGGRVYVVNTDRLFDPNSQLITPEELDNWRRGNKRSLTDIYLERRKARRPLTPLDDMALYSMPENADMRGDQQYRPFIRTGHGLAYIPGSSLKGAMRNAWLYHYLNTNPDYAKNIAKEIMDLLTNVSKEISQGRDNDKTFSNLKKDLDKIIKERIFRAGFTPNANPENIQSDLFKVISVSDSHPFTNLMMAAEEVRVVCDRLSSIFDKRGDLVLYHKTTLVQECLSERRSFEFTVNINQKLGSLYQQQKNAPQFVEQFLDNADGFFREVWDYERNFYRPDQPDAQYYLERDDAPMGQLSAFYDSRLPEKGKGWLLRVGAGSGLHSVTPDIRFSPANPDRMLNELLDVFDAQLKDENDTGKSLLYWLGRYAFWEDKHKASIFPKSRKVVWRTNRANPSGYVYPLGWLWLERI